MAWLLPVAVDGYVVVGLVLWMADVPEKVARFAKRNTYGAAGIGITAQSAYHLLFTLSETDQGWRVALAAVVGALPPAVAALAVHMRALIRRESNPTNQPTNHDTMIAVDTLDTPTMAAVPAPIPVPDDQAAPVPSPAQAAARITPPAPAPGRPAPVPARATTAIVSPKPADPVVSRAPLAPPATDTPVTAPGAAQPTPIARRPRPVRPRPTHRGAVPRRTRHPDHRRQARFAAQGVLRTGRQPADRHHHRTVHPDRQRPPHEG